MYHRLLEQLEPHLFPPIWIPLLFLYGKIFNHLEVCQILAHKYAELIRLMWCRWRSFRSKMSWSLARGRRSLEWASSNKWSTTGTSCSRRWVTGHFPEIMKWLLKTIRPLLFQAVSSRNCFLWEKVDPSAKPSHSNSLCVSDFWLNCPFKLRDRLILTAAIKPVFILHQEALQSKNVTITVQRKSSCWVLRLSNIDPTAPPFGEPADENVWISGSVDYKPGPCGCILDIKPTCYFSGMFYHLRYRNLTRMTTRMRHLRQSLRTSQRMTEGTKTGTEGDGAEILRIRPTHRGASLP